MNFPRNGYIGSSDVVAQMGKGFLGSAWTGEESPTRPMNEMSGGNSGTIGKDGAHARAEEAHQRYRAAAYLLLKKLASGERFASLINRSTGEISGPIAVDFWHRDRALGFLVDGAVPVEWWNPTPPDYGIEGLHDWNIDGVPPEYGRLLIALPTTEKPISVPSITPPNASTSAVSDAPIVATKGGGGRPRKHDWEAVQLELVRLDHEDGIANKTTSDLVRHVQRWCATTGRAEPAESEIKKRIRAVRAALGIGIET